ncbi:MAG: hypothetical protein ABIR08_02435 [Sphingomonas sp.]
MVDKPNTVASRLRRIDIVVAIVILLLVVLHFSAGDADPVRMVGLFAPDLAIWLTGFKISALLEAAASFAAALAVLRRVKIHSAIVTFHFVKDRESKANRARRIRLRNRASPANDDEDGAELALAS